MSLSTTDSLASTTDSRPRLRNKQAPEDADVWLYLASTSAPAIFLDLPAGSPGGGVELFPDLYTGDKPLIPARAFMLAPAMPRPQLPPGSTC